MDNAVTVGQIYSGKVVKIKPFGAIVTIPSLPGSPPGLVHISQIASGFIASVADVLAVDDEVDVRVISYEAATGKIALSMKDVPQQAIYDDEPEADEHGSFYYEAAPISPAQAANFEEKLKSWQKLSNERIAGINRRNKRNKRR